MIVILKNNFHNTEYKTIVRNEFSSMSPSDYVRAMNSLCGIDGCNCGQVRGGCFDNDGRRVDWSYRLIDGRCTIQFYGYQPGKEW